MVTAQTRRCLGEQKSSETMAIAGECWGEDPAVTCHHRRGQAPTARVSVIRAAVTTSARMTKHSADRLRGRGTRDAWPVAARPWPVTRGLCHVAARPWDGGRDRELLDDVHGAGGISNTAGERRIDRERSSYLVDRESVFDRDRDRQDEFRCPRRDYHATDHRTRTGSRE